MSRLKMTLLVLCLPVLSSCGTPRPVVSFPEAPPELMTPAAPLVLLEEGAKLSDISKAGIRNSGLYHEIANRLAQWQSWYSAQKALAEK